MANGNQKTPRPVQANNTDERQTNVNKRRVTEQLPSLLNTDLIKKFFAGAGDHLYQPEISESLIGYIGQIPAHVNFETDFYINEPTKERRDHQLEPTVISSNPETGENTNIMFYDDIINLLRFQGGLVENENRLFDTQYYSWAPCVDLDKLMNFTNYFWFPGGPDTVRITELTDIGAQLGTSNPISIQGIEFTDGLRVVFTNDVDISFRDRIFIVQGIGASFDLVLETELFQHLWDDPAVAWDEGPWDGPDPEFAISTGDPDYIVMARGARDGNPWSTGNRWYHRNELNETQLTIALERQAQRPIIEFCKDLELYNHGIFGRAPVTVRDDITTDPDIEILGQSSVTIDGILLGNGDTILFTSAPSLQGLWDQGPWDLESPPDGEWDPFFNVNYSAAPLDITLTPNTIITASGDFIALGFSSGMNIQLNGTTAQDGIYTIDTVTTTTITLIQPFAVVPSGLPEPNNVTITEQRTVYQNRVFRIDGLGTVGGATLTLVADGQNPDGSPTDGDKIKVLLGQVHQGNEYYWSDEDDAWLLAQQKFTINQAPLFQLYDTEGVKLQDPGKYPQSTFQGSKLFSYDVNEDPRQPIDETLGIRLRFDQFGEIIYENHLVTERFSFNAPQEEIKGYYFHRTLSDTPENDEFNNDWYLAPNLSRQFLVDRFTADDDTKEFDLTLPPDLGTEDKVQVFVNGNELINNPWTFNGTTIIFTDFFENDDFIQVKYFSSLTPPENSNATYEIPINLEANPDNEEVDFISKTDFFSHFSSIIEQQDGFQGSPNGTNNWRNTPKDLSLGTDILQHQAPMLKLLGIGSNRDVDFMRSVRYVEREFSRFRNKFLRKVNEFFNDGIHSDTQPPSEWIEDIFDSINLGKTTMFPFAFSGMGTRINGDPTFIPPSPSRLGVYPVYQPEIYLDLTLRTPREVIQFHDGSIMIAFGDFRDQVILELENNIFDSIPDEFKTEERPDFDWTDFVEAQFRDGDYSIEEFNQLLTPIFQRWAISKNLDPSENKDHSPTDPFTFNYSSQGLPGYWRGIYKQYYDTDRPNTHPWEMFGFSIKPDWWDARYGTRPYKSDNLFLWNDMKVGRIADGPRAGIDPKYARPTAPIPVDGFGNLLDPIAAGIATLPGIVDARAPWEIGDGAPVENLFRRSEFWSYAISQISYLMKPARFIEFGWDPKLGLFRYKDGDDPQWVHSDTEDRKRHSEFTLHGEEQDDGTIFTSDGIQQWISDYVTNNGQSITTRFGNLIRTLEPKLGHKMAGFINFNATRVLADNFGLVPQEDIEVNLYRNPSIREENYSGVIVERVGDGWAVHGYDVLNPVFKIVPGIPTSRKIPIDVNTLRVLECTRFKDGTIVEIPYGTIFRTQQELYDFLISYQRYLESRGWIFDEYDSEVNETRNFRLAGKQFLFWTLGRWAKGSLIALSPAAQQIKFRTEQGAVQSIEQVVNGVYSLLDRDGRVIQPEETFVSRFEDELLVTPEDEQAIYAARLFVAEIEHVITFNNTTIFNDLIYNPLLKLRQSRLKLFTTRAGGWVGRLDAPGYIVTDNGLIPNYEKTTNDFRRYFEVESPVERPAIQDTARRVIGFQTRDYLDDLLLSPNVQFQFYQGFIRKKGTRLTLDRLLRSDATTNAEQLQIFEEWAFRLGEFGAVQDSTLIELLLKEEEIKSTPQLIEFRGSKLRNNISATATSLSVQNGNSFPDTGVIQIDNEILFYSEKSGNILSGLLRGQRDTNAESHSLGAIVGLVDSLFDDILTISPNDERWIMRPPEEGIVDFPFRTLSGSTKRSRNAAYLFRTDINLAGYPLESEVTHRVSTIDERNDLFNQLRITVEDEDLAFGDTVWVDDIGDFYTRNDPDNLFDDDPRSIFNFGFMVYRYTNTGLNFDIPILPSEDEPGAFTTIVTTTPHQLENDDYIMIDGADGSIPDLNSSYFVKNITFEFDGDGSNTIFTMPDNVLLDPDNTTVTFEGSSSIPFEIVGGNETIITSSGSGPFTYDVGSIITIDGIHIDLITPFQPVIPTILGGDPGATYSTGSVISISDGINTATFITLSTGSDVDSAIIDINNSGVANIVASKVADALVLTNGTGGEIIIDNVIGTPVEDLFGVSAPFTTPLPQANVDAAVIDINNAAIPNITASNDNGRLVITDSTGSEIQLDEPVSGVLSSLGLIPGTFKSLGNAIELSSPLPSNATMTVRRDDRFDVNIAITTNGNYNSATIGIYTESRFFGVENPHAGDRNDIIYRDNIETPQGNPIPWNDGEFVYVDQSDQTELSNGIKPWAVYEYDSTLPSPFWKIATFDNVNRIQTGRVDTELFKQGLIYNKDTDITDVRLNIWDPAKGLFPGQTIKEVDFKLEYDPAKYTNGDQSQFQIDPEQSWGEEKVGLRWWDLSTVEYEQYEIGSNRERRNKWGRIAPGKSIDVYEWVRSSVPPTQWSDLVEQSAGEPESSFRYKPSGEAFKANEVDNPPHTQRRRINQNTGNEEITYYFWVKRSETIPNVKNKNLSSAQVARQMENPTGAGIPWYAPINENAIIISGVDSFLTTEDSVLQLNFNSSRTEVNLHREWILSREGDESDVPNDRFWNKMRDSMIGFMQYTDSTNGNMVTVPVPDPNLEESRRYGNFIRPRQTWFVDRTQASKIFITCVNDLLSQECIVDTRTDIFDNLFNASEEPTLYTGPDPRLPCEYDYHVSDLIVRNQLTNQTILDVDNNPVGPMSINEHVWVDGTPDTAGFWKVYRYDGDDLSGQPIFTELCSESYRVADFWQQVNFVEEGFDIDTPIDITVDTLAQRDALPNPTDGLIVRVNDSNSDGSNIWAIFEYDSSQLNPWVLQAKQDCTIEFDANLFSDPTYGNIDVRTDLNGRDQALKEVIDALRTNILTDLEQNLVFYKMVKYVHTEQLLIDWAFKTTYIKAVGLNRTANQDPIFRPDTTDSFIQFIEEAKPYHTKLRDFVINENLGIDLHETNVTDFDKPVYFDEGINDFRVLDPNDPDDMAIMAEEGSDQFEWFNAHQSNPDLVRHFTTTILFDRVSCDIGGGWDPVFGWDFGPNENWDLGLDEVGETAAERILRFYQPQPLNQEDVEEGQVDPFKNIQETKDLASIISGCNFKGTIVDGGGMIIDIDDIDTFLDGGPLANPGAPIEPEDIIVDGNLFIQPDVDSDHPEELSLQTIGEAISIKVHTLGMNGAPQILSRIYQGLSAGPFSIGQKPGSKEALFVYVNGVRARQDEFSYNTSDDTITLLGSLAASISPIDFITIISFSVGGGEEIIASINDVGDGIEDTYALGLTPPSSGQVFVTVAGEIKSDTVDYNVVGSDVIFTAPPPNGDEIIITVFATSSYTIVRTNQFDVVSPFTTADNRHAIGQTIAASLITDIENAFVSINGIRQIPFDPNDISKDYDYRVDQGTDEIVFVVKVFGLASATYTNSEDIFINGNQVFLTTGTTVSDAVIDINAASITNIQAIEINNTLVIINTDGGNITLAEGGGTALNDLGFSPSSTDTNFTVDSSIIISSLINEYLTVECSYDGSTNVYGVNHDIQVEQQIEVILNPLTSPTTLTQGVDYTVNTSLDTVDITLGVNSSAIVIGDEIRIRVFYASTERFDGNSNGILGRGEYILAQPITDLAKLFVHLNGVKVESGDDFEIIDERTIRFFNSHTSNDKIVATMLTGRSLSSPPIAFRLFLNNLNARASNNIRPILKTALSNPITAASTTIKIQQPIGLPETGVLVIVNDHGDFLRWELVRYSGVDIATGDVTVLERGFETTIPDAHPSGTVVFALDPTISEIASWDSLRISDEGTTELAQDLNLTDATIELTSVSGLPKQKPAETRMTKPGVIWLEGEVEMPTGEKVKYQERIEYFRRDGTTLKFIRRGTQGTSSSIPAVYDINGNLLTDFQTASNFKWLSGTKVIDGTAKQEIPGGYRWEPTPFGLQFQDSTISKFLKDKPGSC